MFYGLTGSIISPNYPNMHPKFNQQEVITSPNTFKHKIIQGHYAITKPAADVPTFSINLVDVETLALLDGATELEIEELGAEQGYKCA